jgi:hypothetical protein
VLNESWVDHTNEAVLERMSKNKEVTNTGKIRKLEYLVMRNDTKYKL